MSSLTKKSFLVSVTVYIVCVTYATNNKSSEEECFANVTRIFTSPDPKQNFLYAYLNYSEDQFTGSEESTISIEAYGYFLDLLNSILHSNIADNRKLWSPLKFCEVKHREFMLSCVDYIAAIGPDVTVFRTGAGAFYFMYRVLDESKLTLECLYPKWYTKYKYDDKEGSKTQRDKEYWQSFWERKVAVVKEYYYLLHEQIKSIHFNKQKTPMQYCSNENSERIH